MSEQLKSNKISDNKRIAKNSFVLYVRMFISLIVGLYTSRVVLNVLGVSDYGIYGVVAGVVGMMGFLNATMSGATSRFITFELGKGNIKKLADTFSSALIVHSLIAFFVLLVAETIGLWFLNNKLVIPEERLIAANWVYQFSIVSSIATILQVPYNACIISHEKMEVYAYVEILNVILKLIIVYFLQVLAFDKLIMYSFLYLVTSIVVMAIYLIYCFKHFCESRFRFVWDKSIIKALLSFSGWDLYGNFAGVVRQQGVNMVINMFFGPILNAASSIATTVSGVIMQFAGNVVISIKPQIIKCYALENFQETVRLINIGCIINFILLSFLSIPVIVEMHYVLFVWLKTVPDYAEIFCKFSLIFNILANQSLVIITGIHATGKIKKPSIFLGTLYILVIPITYAAFKLGNHFAWLPYLVNVLAVLIGISINAYILHRYLPMFSFKSFIYRLIFKFILPFLVVLSLTSWITTMQEESFARLIITGVISTTSLALLSYFWILPKSIITAITAIVQQLFNKIFNHEND